MIDESKLLEFISQELRKEVPIQKVASQYTDKGILDSSKSREYAYNKVMKEIFKLARCDRMGCKL